MKSVIMSGKERAMQKKEKLSSQLLRERLGGIPPEPLQLSRQQAKIHRQIKEALKDGSKTVPEVSEKTQIPSAEVFWHLMSMKKYGEVIEGEERDSYIAYALQPKEGKKS